MDLFYFIFFSFPWDIGLALLGCGGGEKHPKHPAARGRVWQTCKWVLRKVPKLMSDLRLQVPSLSPTALGSRTHVMAGGDRVEQWLGKIGAALVSPIRLQ